MFNLIKDIDSQEFWKGAKENKLLPDEGFGATFTITNPGIFGSLFGMGIINQPNVAYTLGLFLVLQQTKHLNG